MRPDEATILYLLASAGVATGMYWARQTAVRRRTPHLVGHPLDPEALAYLRSGEPGIVGVAHIGLTRRGLVQTEGALVQRTDQQPDDTLEPGEALMWGALSQPRTMRELAGLAEVRARGRTLRKRLAASNHIPQSVARWLWLTAWCLCVALLVPFQAWLERSGARQGLLLIAAIPLAVTPWLALTGWKYTVHTARSVSQLRRRFRTSDSSFGPGQAMAYALFGANSIGSSDLKDALQTLPDGSGLEGLSGDSLGDFASAHGTGGEFEAGTDIGGDAGAGGDGG